MRFYTAFDTIYVLSSLGGSSLGPQVCPANPSLSNAAVELAWSSRRRASSPVTAFVDVNVVPMDSERVLPNHTVLVEGGQITALGPARQVKVPAGAVRVDGRGKYLMPGLTDMHFHGEYFPTEGTERTFADRLFLEYAAHGVTALRALYQSSGKAMPAWRRLLAEFPVPRMYLALDQFPKFPWAQPDSVVAAAKAVGYHHIVAARHADSLTMGALRRGGLPPTTHGHGIPFPQVLELGAGGGSVEHLYLFWDSLLGKPGPGGPDPNETFQPVNLPMAKVPALAAAVKRSGVWVTPTLACMKAVYPHFRGNSVAGLVKALHDAGVKLLLGSDGSAVSHGSVHGELVALVQAGLTPYQALLTGTRNVAEYFGLLDSTGTVAVGKQADLVLLNGNPLQDVRHTWEVAGVMLRGRWLDRAALDQRLLAAPRMWFGEVLLRLPGSYVLTIDGVLPYLSSPARSLAQWQELTRHGERTLALIDSLDRTNRQVYERVLPLVTAELGTIRTLMTPQEREAFDVNVQAWVREQARQGYTVTIPGVPPR